MKKKKKNKLSFWIWIS